MLQLYCRSSSMLGKYVRSEGDRDEALRYLGASVPRKCNNARVALHVRLPKVGLLMRFDVKETTTCPSLSILSFTSLSLPIPVTVCNNSPPRTSLFV
ncbi:hypothetical protein BT69DRAFT_822701 [Atractiella rhizophila]|nr:hypothetical protein BT69DRAFT_632308 [Atractiella rhizophila]KAH8927331.1 hypothetical protein BT69DRAFT_822701 [Atractiella rhizophila]